MRAPFKSRATLASPEISDPGGGFIDHWKGLRAGALVPTLDAWIKNLPPWIATQTLRAELLSSDAVVIFLGSDLEARRTRNYPGSSVFAPFPDRRVPGMENLGKVVNRPCGLIRAGILPRYGARFKDIVLPLAPPQGRLPQFIVFSWDWATTAESTDTLPGPQWLDIGAGVPTAPPL